MAGMNRPRKDMSEWREAESATDIHWLRYALWQMLWHNDAENAWGDLLIETRRPGYDGPLTT